MCDVTTFVGPATVLLGYDRYRMAIPCCNLQSSFAVARLSDPVLHRTRFSSARPNPRGVLQWRAVRVSELQTLYEDGYALLHKFLTEDELPALNSNVVSSDFFGGQRGQRLGNLVGKLVRIEVETSFVQEPGFKCTDGASSPEPWWEHTWEVDKLDIDDRECLGPASKTATLVVSCSGSTIKYSGGSFCVFPRSHWLTADWLCENSGRTSLASLPNSFDIPAATVIELDLGSGDAVLLHPMLAWSLAPNISKSTTNFLICSLYAQSLNEGEHSSSQSVQMWRNWTALTSQLSRGLTAFESQDVQLIEEEVKALRGGWATQSHLGNLPNLPFSCSYVAPRDYLAWQLRSCADDLMQREKWEEAMVMLQRLAGLCPRSYWVVYQAGRCCTLSAPRGQLAGRAGRKSRLEDAERFLLRAIEMAPGWPHPYSELAQVLSLLGRGREKEISNIFQTMKMKCNFDQLCFKYPHSSDDLKQCKEKCELILSKISA